MKNKLSQLNYEMKYLQFQGDLQSFEFYNNKIVYLTSKELSAIDVVIQPKKEFIPIKGDTVIAFTVGGNGYVAILYITSTIQIRKIGKLQQVIYKVQSIQYDIQKSTPLMKWEMHELYCIYDDKIQIIDTIYKKRKGYTNMLDAYPNEKLIDILHSNMMDGQKLITLVLQKRLVFTIMPLTVTQLQIQHMTACSILSHPKLFAKYKRQYLLILTNHRYLKVYDFLNLKQICEIDFKTIEGEQYLECINQPLNQFLMIKKYKRKKDKYGNDTGVEVIKYYLLKINKEQYYQKERESSKSDLNSGNGLTSNNFFNFCIELPFKHNNLFILSTHREIIQKQYYTSIDMSYINDNIIYLISSLTQDNSSNALSEYAQYHRPNQWKENSEWQSIISSYIEMSDQLNQDFPKSTMEQITQSSFLIQQQVRQFNMIKQDFDNLVKQFHQQLYKQSINQTIVFKDQEEQQIFIERQWNRFFQNYLKRNNFKLNYEAFAQISIQRGPPQLKKVRSRQNLVYNQKSDLISEQKWEKKKELKTFEIISQIAKREQEQKCKKNYKGILEELTKIQKQKLQQKKLQIRLQEVEKQIKSKLRIINQSNLQSIEQQLFKYLVNIREQCAILVQEIFLFALQERHYGQILAKLCIKFSMYPNETFKFDQPFQFPLNQFSKILLQRVQFFFDVQTNSREFFQMEIHKKNYQQSIKNKIINSALFIAVLTREQVFGLKNVNSTITQYLHHFLIQYSFYCQKQNDFHKCYQYYFQAALQFISELGQTFYLSDKQNPFYKAPQNQSNYQKAVTQIISIILFKKPYFEFDSGLIFKLTSNQYIELLIKIQEDILKPNHKYLDNKFKKFIQKIKNQQIKQQDQNFINLDQKKKQKNEDGNIYSLIQRQLKCDFKMQDNKLMIQKNTVDNSNNIEEKQNINQEEDDYQQFVKKFILQLREREKLEELEREENNKKKKELQQQNLIYEDLQAKIQNQMISVDELHEYISKHNFCEQINQNLRLKMLEMRFRQVILGKKDLPDPQQIDRIIGKHYPVYQEHALKMQSQKFDKNQGQNQNQGRIDFVYPVVKQRQRVFFPNIMKIEFTPLKSETNQSSQIKEYETKHKLNQQELERQKQREARQRQIRLKEQEQDRLQRLRLMLKIQKMNEEADRERQQQLLLKIEEQKKLKKEFQERLILMQQKKLSTIQQAKYLQKSLNSHYKINSLQKDSKTQKSLQQKMCDKKKSKQLDANLNEISKVNKNQFKEEDNQIIRGKKQIVNNDQGLSKKTSQDVKINKQFLQQQVKKKSKKQEKKKQKKQKKKLLAKNLQRSQSSELRQQQQKKRQCQEIKNKIKHNQQKIKKRQEIIQWTKVRQSQTQKKKKQTQSLLQKAKQQQIQKVQLEQQHKIKQRKKQNKKESNEQQNKKIDQKKQIQIRHCQVNIFEVMKNFQNFVNKQTSRNYGYQLEKNGQILENVTHDTKNLVRKEIKKQKNGKIFYEEITQIHGNSSKVLLNSQIPYKNLIDQYKKMSKKQFQQRKIQVLNDKIQVQQQKQKTVCIVDEQKKKKKKKKRKKKVKTSQQQQNQKESNLQIQNGDSQNQNEEVEQNQNEMNSEKIQNSAANQQIQSNSSQNLKCQAQEIEEYNKTSVDQYLKKLQQKAKFYVEKQIKMKQESQTLTIGSLLQQFLSSTVFQNQQENLKENIDSYVLNELKEVSLQKIRLQQIQRKYSNQQQHFKTNNQKQVISETHNLISDSLLKQQNEQIKRKRKKKPPKKPEQPIIPSDNACIFQKRQIKIQDQWTRQQKQSYLNGLNFQELQILNQKRLALCIKIAKADPKNYKLIHYNPIFAMVSSNVLTYTDSFFIQLLQRISMQGQNHKLKMCQNGKFKKMYQDFIQKYKQCQGRYCLFQETKKLQELINTGKLFASQKQNKQNQSNEVQKEIQKKTIQNISVQNFQKNQRLSSQQNEPKRQYIQLKQNIIQLIYDLDQNDQVIEKMKKEMIQNINKEFQKERQNRSQIFIKDHEEKDINLNNQMQKQTIDKLGGLNQNLVNQEEIELKENQKICFNGQYILQRKTAFKESAEKIQNRQNQQTAVNYREEELDKVRSISCQQQNSLVKQKEINPSMRQKRDVQTTQLIEKESPKSKKTNKINKKGKKIMYVQKGEKNVKINKLQKVKNTGNIVQVQINQMQINPISIQRQEKYIQLTQKAQTLQNICSVPYKIENQNQDNNISSQQINPKKENSNYQHQSQSVSKRNIKEQSITLNLQSSKRQIKSKSQIIFTHQPIFQLQNHSNLAQNKQFASNKSSHNQVQVHHLKIQKSSLTNLQNQSLNTEPQHCNQSKKSQQYHNFHDQHQNQEYIPQINEQQQLLVKNRNDLLQYLTEQSSHIFKPLQKSLQKVAQKLQIIQDKCSQTLTTFQNYMQMKSPHTLQNYVKRYFSQMVGQITCTVNSGYKHFEQRIDQLQSKSQKNFNQVVENYQKYFEHQVKHRLQIFNKNRQTVQNELRWVRNEIKEQKQQIINQEQKWISEQQLMRQLKRRYWFKEQEMKKMQQRLLKQKEKSGIEGQMNDKNDKGNNDKNKNEKRKNDEKMMKQAGKRKNK